MSLNPRKYAVVIVSISVVLVLAGCDLKAEESKQVKGDAPLLSKIEKGEQAPLDEIVGKSAEALDLTSATVDPYVDDEYLFYVNEAKERDRDKRNVATAGTADGLTESLAAAVVSITEGLVDGLTGMFGEIDEAIAVDDGGQKVSDDGGAAVVDDGSSDDDGTTDDDGAADDENSNSRYVSASDGFSILFPDGWQVKEAADGDKNSVVAESAAEDKDDGFFENIAVDTEELPLEMNLQEYTDAVIGALGTELTNFAEVERSKVTLDGKTAKKVIYTFSSGRATFKATVHVVLNGLKGYTVTGVAAARKFQSFRARFTATTESFEFE